MRIKADLALLLVAILWGSAFPAQRIAGQAGSVYLFNGARFLVATLFLSPFVFKKKYSKTQLLWMGIAGSILFLGSALQQFGLKTTTAGNAGFITSLSLVIVPFLVYSIWKERPHRFAYPALFLAAGGAFLLSTSGEYKIRAGDWYELAGAVFWALHVVLIGKMALEYDFTGFAAGQFLVAALANLLTGSLVEDPGALLSVDIVAAILFTAIFSISLGFTLQIWAQRHTPPIDAALILSLESVFAVLAGWIVLGETLGAIQIAGCGLILLAVILSQAKDWGFR